MGHPGPVLARDTVFDLAVLFVAATFGLVTWIATMASAPRYSYGAEQDMGSPALYYVLLGAAFLGGVLRPQRGWLIGMVLGLPALLLSPWTAPRGDDDGLWALIVPILGVFVFVLAAMASLGAWVRTRAANTGRSHRAQ